MASLDSAVLRAPGEILLDVQDLETAFSTRRGPALAVNGVSLQVRRGETVGIVGESGSGKSALSLSIMGLVPKPAGRITRGRVMFDGRDLREASPEQLRRVRGKHIAMIFQDPMSALNPVLTVRRQITESLTLHEGLSNRAARERAIKLLRKVGIPSPETRLDDYPHEFSGGMRQRVMIASALACNPELLIADEPTTALDVTIQAQILKLIRDLAADTGAAVVLITHDLGVVAGMANRVIVMYAGHVVEEGPTRRIFKSPSMPYTMGLLRSMPSPVERQERLHPIRGLPPDLSSPPPGCPFGPRCDYFRPGLCDVSKPPLREIEEGHKAACHFDFVSGPAGERVAVSARELVQ